MWVCPFAWRTRIRCSHFSLEKVRVTIRDVDWLWPTRCLKGWVGSLLLVLLDSYSVFPNRCVPAFSVFLSAPNKPKDLSINQMRFENIFRLKKFFRTNGLTEDTYWYNTVKVKGYGGSLGFLRVGMTLRRPLAVRSRGLECRCFRRRNSSLQKTKNYAIVDLSSDNGNCSFYIFDFTSMRIYCQNKWSI